MLKSIFKLFVLVFALISFNANAFQLFPEWNFANHQYYGDIESIQEVYPHGEVNYFFKDGKLSKKVFHSENSVENVFTLSYNDSGKISAINYIKAKAFIEQQRAIYSDEVISKFEYVNSDGKVYRSSSMVVTNSAGFVTFILFQTPQNENIEMAYDFNEKNFIKKVSITVSNKQLMTAVFTCDRYGNVIEAERFNDKMVSVGIIKNSYKYDKNGNWIEKSSAFMQKASKIPVKEEKIVRKIIYKGEK